MTHDPSYVDTLTSEEQIKRGFVTSKGNGSHISLLRLLRSGLTIAQVERYVEDEVRQHYLQLKSRKVPPDSMPPKVLFDALNSVKSVASILPLYISGV